MPRSMLVRLHHHWPPPHTLTHTHAHHPSPAKCDDVVLPKSDRLRWLLLESVSDDMGGRSAERLIPSSSQMLSSVSKQHHHHHRLDVLLIRCPSGSILDTCLRLEIHPKAHRCPERTTSLLIADPLQQRSPA
ncbi:unnamed protein product [Periconia digitata]|uniref:Uncharacterized protein n=1 Tax=Periconia digitata TaxID=1303443 RepID=A0A9W4UFW4_9PLEO|nr:unnamed protein product [Periconia digitata]